MIKPQFNRRKAEIVSLYQRQCKEHPDIHLAVIGDSIISNWEKHYPRVWDSTFPASHLNLGISGDTIQGVWWRLLNSGLPDSVKKIIVHVGTNNVSNTKSSTDEIIDGFISMISDMKNKYNKSNIFVSSILPRYDRRGSYNMTIDKINKGIADRLPPDIMFIQHQSILVENMFGDKLHLVKSGYKKLSDSLKDVLSFNADAAPIDTVDGESCEHTQSKSIPNDLSDKGFSDLTSRKKKNLRNIYRIRACRKCIFLPPILPDDVPSYLPYSPKVNRKGHRRRKCKTPVTSEGDTNM